MRIAIVLAGKNSILHRAHLEVSCKRPPARRAVQALTNNACTEVHKLASEVSAATREFSCMSHVCSHKRTPNLMTADMQPRCTGATVCTSCLVKGGKKSSGSGRCCFPQSQDCMLDDVYVDASGVSSRSHSRPSGRLAR